MLSQPADPSIFRLIGDCPMTVLVTGGAGYIGSHMALRLGDAGEPMVVLDNLTTGFDWAVDHRATFVQGDASDMDFVGGLIAEHKITEIIHFAGSIVVPESVIDPLKYYRNNTATSRNLLEAAVKGGVERFIFSSTAAVYGMTGLAPVEETTPLLPMSPYGRSQADDRVDAGRRRRGASDQVRRAALLQRRRRRSEEALGPVDAVRHASDQGRGADGARAAAEDGHFRHRLSDAGRHLRPRLHPRHRPDRGAQAAARPPARGRRLARRSTAPTGRAIRCGR